MSMSCSMMSTVMAGSRPRRRSAMSWDSLGERPAVGSSSRSTRGWPARASAISSWRCSPWERFLTVVAARSSSPTARSAARARSFNRVNRSSERSMTNFVRVSAWTASRPFSSALKLGKRLVTWKVRASPSAARRCGGSSVTSWSKRWMAPELTSSSPEIRLNSVVLPAPFGPMMARRSPGWTARSTPSTASRPPNDRETRASRSATDPDRAALSAVLAGRGVARVQGQLHVLLGVVLPELPDTREGRDHRVPELARDPLHLAHVDGLHRIAPLVHADGAARRVLDVHLAESRQELVALLDLAADGLDGLHDPAGAGVGGLGVVGRALAGPGLEGPGELLVLGRVDGRRVVERGDGADGLVAHLRQHGLVRRGAAAQERDLALEPGRLVLLHERERQPPHEQREDGVRVALDLGQERREVVRVERRPDLLDDLAAGLLERALEAAHRLPAEGVVHADRRDPLVLEGPRHPVTERMHRLARGPAGAYDPPGRLPLGQVVGGDHGEGGRDALAVDERLERVAGGGQEAAREHVHPVLLDQLARLGERGGRRAFAVLHDQLDLATRGLAADLVEVELGADEHVLARRGEGARERGEQADLDRPTLAERPAGRP